MIYEEKNFFALQIPLRVCVMLKFFLAATNKSEICDWFPIDFCRHMICGVFSVIFRRPYHKLDLSSKSMAICKNDDGLLKSSTSQNDFFSRFFDPIVP